MTLTLRECIICCGRVKVKDGGLNASNLKSQLLNYFAVKKLFGISEATCLYLLQNKGNPSNWMSCCKKCSNTVKTADILYRELKELENKWNRLKHELETKMCNHYLKTSTLKNKDITGNSINGGMRNDIREKIEKVLRKDSSRSESFTVDINNILKHEKDVDIEDFQNDFVDDYLQQSWSETLVKTEIFGDKNSKTLSSSYEGFSDDEEYGPETGLSDSESGPIPCQESEERPLTNTTAALPEDNQSSPQKNYLSDANNSNELGRRTRSGLIFGNFKRHPPRVYSRKKTLSESESDDSDYRPSKHTKKTTENRTQRKYPIVVDGLPCELCSLTFATMDDIRNHKYMRHKEQHSFRCNMCSRDIGRLHSNKIKAHMLRKHGIQKAKNSCDFCEQRFTTIERKQTHENRFHEDKLEVLHLFKCNECSKEFTDAHDLFRHRYGDHNLKHLKSKFHIDTLEKELGVTMIVRENLPFNCKVCYHQFRTEDKLKEHDYLAHVKFEDETKLPFECKECDKKFIYVRQMEAHVADIHTKERNFMCEVCSRCFGTPSRLQNHQRTIHGDKRIQCELCLKSCGDQKSYERHKKKFHDDPFPFRCPGCNMGVATKSAMKKHYLERCKGAVKKEICDLCQKAFIDKEHLQRHKELHTKDRQFSCLTCGAEFTKKSSLQRHEETVHLRCKTYRCELCGKDFFARGSLYQHVAKGFCPSMKANFDAQSAVVTNVTTDETDTSVLDTTYIPEPEIIPTDAAMNSEHLQQTHLVSTLTPPIFGITPHYYNL